MHQLKIANLIYSHQCSLSQEPIHVKQAKECQMQRKLALVTEISITLLIVVYLIYYGLSLQDKIFTSNFFYFTIVLYAMSIVGLSYTTYRYSKLMQTRWGDSFDEVIRRVNLISLSIIFGYVLCASFQVILIITGDVKDI